jgi:hypothetical protein
MAWDKGASALKTLIRLPAAPLPRPRQARVAKIAEAKAKLTEIEAELLRDGGLSGGA